MTTDSHCHLGQEDYDLDISEIISMAQKEGVHTLMGVACDPKDWTELLGLLEKEKNVYGAIGIHPEYAHLNQKEALKKLENLFLKNSKLVAVGEIGLDYHENSDSKEAQKDLFYQQIILASKLNKPIMIHTRDAEDDTIKILQKAYKEGLLISGGVIHCFTGSTQMAQKALKFGFYISASGVITFKSAKELRETFKDIPVERLLVETDAPWLAPEPFRGHKNQPAYVQKTLEKLAEIKEISCIELKKITDDNFKKLYLGG